MAMFIRPRLYWIPAALPFLRLGQTIFPKDVPVEPALGDEGGSPSRLADRLSESNRIRSEGPPISAGGCRSVWRAASHPYLRLPVFAATPEERDRIYALSQKHGLGVSVAYPTPISEIPEMRAAFNGQRFPSARRVAEHLLTIPTHQWLSESDKRAIAECVGAGAAAVPSHGAAQGLLTASP